MAITLVNIIPRKLAEGTVAAQYTATNCKTVIDKFTATNVSVSVVSISIYLIPAGGTAGIGNKVVSSKSIAVNETYAFPELVGQSLESGGFISTIATLANSLTISATGREIT
jgi:hypothetical protein